MLSLGAIKISHPILILLVSLRITTLTYHLWRTEAQKKFGVFSWRYLILDKLSCAHHKLSLACSHGWLRKTQDQQLMAPSTTDWALPDKITNEESVLQACLHPNFTETFSQMRLCSLRWLVEPSWRKTIQHTHYALFSSPALADLLLSPSTTLKSFVPNILFKIKILGCSIPGGPNQIFLNIVETHSSLIIGKEMK